MTAPVRTDADWTIEGRAMLGHEVLDLAPTADEHPCYTGWYARLLGVNQYQQSATLRPLMDRMARVGLLEKTGGATTCRGPCGRVPASMLPWCEAQGIDPTHTHMDSCYYRLAVDRHDAHERWSEHVQRPRWRSQR